MRQTNFALMSDGSKISAGSFAGKCFVEVQAASQAMLDKVNKVLGLIKPHDSPSVVWSANRAGFFYFQKDQVSRKFFNSLKR